MACMCICVYIHTPQSRYDPIQVMNVTRHNIFQGHFDVVTTLRDRNIEAQVEQLVREDELTIALRSMLKMGADINTLSEASGLTVAEIRKRVDRDLRVIEDTASLAGLV